MKPIVYCVFAGVLAYGQDAAVNRITGVVRGVGGQPLQGEVSAVGAGAGLQITVAKITESGTFEISVPPGRVTLTARADGYASEQREIAIRANDRGLRLEFVLVPAGAVAGKVVDASGAPVPGARVWLTYPGEADGWRRAEEAGGEETDAFGSFRIPVVARGRPFVLHAESESWLMSSSGVLRLAGSDLEEVLLVLSRRGTTIVGRVIDGVGKAAAGAAIHVRVIPGQSEYTEEQRRTPAFARALNRFATANSDGAFAVSGVPVGQVIVTAELASVRASTQVGSEAGRQATVLLTLR